MGKKLAVISFVFIFVFGFIGVFIVDTLIHENIHKYDLKEFVVKGTDKICLLDENLNGYYSYLINSEDEEEWAKANKYSEFKAYSVGIVILLLYYLCVLRLFKQVWYGDKDEG